MDKEKDKKKTLTISSNFKKKIEPGSLLKKIIKNLIPYNNKKNVFKSIKKR